MPGRLQWMAVLLLCAAGWSSSPTAKIVAAGSARNGSTTGLGMVRLAP